MSRSLIVGREKHFVIKKVGLDRSRPVTNRKHLRELEFLNPSLIAHCLHPESWVDSAATQVLCLYLLCIKSDVSSYIPTALTEVSTLESSFLCCWEILFSVRLYH